MGNNGSQLGDEPSTGMESSSSSNNRSLQHFDHTFKGELHTAHGPIFADVFGECKFEKREVQIVCKGNFFELIEDVGFTARKQTEINYTFITAMSWDHANSQVKVEVKRNPGDEENFVILTTPNTIELEGEFKLRLHGMASSVPGSRVPPTMYIGMFAGANKPKPFQRKRPNLSHLPNGKLPQLNDMRNNALQLQKGSYKPCPPGESRRIELAVQHIYEGFNSFSVLRVRGTSAVANQWRPDSVIQIKDDVLIFKPFGGQAPTAVEFLFDDITEWKAEDNDHLRPNDSCIELTSTSGDRVGFYVPHIRDAQHTFEFFWNQHQVANGRPVKLGSTHGRPIVTVTTLSGEAPAPESIPGQTEVVDQDGILVRPGGKMMARRSSLTEVIGGSKEPKTVPSENREVKKHWHRVVMHQGWLLKKGGLGVGSAKSWIKRYFVLYNTSQGHFLFYYADFTECPLYSHDRAFRNVVDLAKTTFIRPGSNKAEASDTPPHSFDIVTTEREWTLCAEGPENEQKWLKLITRGVDEDVAILPDEELLFKVKPKVDPLGILCATDYSTSLRVSANGISVCTPDTTVQPSYSGAVKEKLGQGPEKETYFWVYTDFYKWSLLSQGGKLALLVNVFADASFSRRNEYIFRNKEAVRLATAIEFFIEKFMSVMHIRLETTEGAFEVPEGKAEVVEAPGNGGLHNVAADDWNTHHEDEVELDLLGLDLSPSAPSAPPATAPTATANAFGDDPFGDDDAFGSSSPSSAASPSPAPVVAPAAPVKATSYADDFDLLGSSDHEPVPVVAAVKAAAPVDIFASDPFGGDFFDGGAAAPASTPAVKVAPPLTPAQLALHAQWLQLALTKNGGPLYEDGTLQVATTIDVRGSQGRVTFFFRNNSPAILSNFKVEVHDDAGLTRFELGPGPATITGLSQAQQQLMMECMKPAAPGPTVVISYTDSLLGDRSNTLPLPVTVTTFNEPLTLAAQDFMTRWEQLVAPGLQGQEVFSPSRPVVPANIANALTTALRFGNVHGIPGESEFVLHGVSSLRTGSLTPTGEKISIGCLVKIEMNVQSNSIRVTTRTLHPAATAAIMATAKSLLC